MEDECFCYSIVIGKKNVMEKNTVCVCICVRAYVNLPRIFCNKNVNLTVETTLDRFIFDATHITLSSTYNESNKHQLQMFRICSIYVTTEQSIVQRRTVPRMFHEQRRVLDSHAISFEISFRALHYFRYRCVGKSMS